MAGRCIEKADSIVHAAALGIIRGIIEPSNPGVSNGAGAHRAGFQRRPQVAILQPIIAEEPGCFPNRDNLGMGRGVMIDSGAIVAPTDDISVPDDNRPDRHFANRGGRIGQGQCIAHE